MPSAMAGVFNTHEHNAHNVTSRMLSGLRGRYVPEWSDIYAAIAAYIDEMFSDRNKLIDNKNEPVHGQIHVWLLSDEPWQIQGHAMVLSRHFAEQVIPV